MYKFPLLLVVLLGTGHVALAAYDPNENCRKAWMCLMDLNIDQAKSILAGEIRRDPTNYYCYYLDQTCDAFRLIINSGDGAFDQFLENYRNKRKIMDGKDETSPWYLLCASEMELQVTVFSVMHNAQVSGVSKGVAAYKDLHANMKAFPGFMTNAKLDGFFNVALANVPPFVKWALSLMSVDVNIQKGFGILDDYYRHERRDPGFNAEAALYVILAAKINKTPEMLDGFEASLDTSISRTFIHRYFRANIDYWSARNDEALTVLRGTSPGNNPYARIIYSYMMGKILLRKCDPGAEKYLQDYLSHLEKKEYVKEINYCLALLYLLQDNRQKYEHYCDIVRNTGLELNERDREAMYNASLDYIPDVNLVRAQLALDGGYYDAGHRAITAFEGHHNPVSAYDIEYHLLKGRYAEIQSNDNLAMAEYRKVIALGEHTDYYFASDAALRLGDICKRIGQKKLATSYYRKSISLYRKRFYEYIEDKARKGLQSLEGK
jgi:hypothetical protein